MHEVLGIPQWNSRDARAGRVVYAGPRTGVVPFFESMGFRCPERKAVPDFLQEVNSIKDQAVRGSTRA